MMILKSGFYSCWECGGQIETWKDNPKETYLSGWCTTESCKHFHKKVRIPLERMDV